MSKLSFEMALANMKRGKMVRRACEPDTAYAIIADRITVWQRVEGGEKWEFVGVDGFLRAVDVLSDDWEVVE